MSSCQDALYQFRENVPVDEKETPDPEVFDDGKAEWAIRKIAIMQEEIERVKAQMKALIARHESDLNSFLWYATPRLDEWLRRKTEDDPKHRQSVITPYGTVKRTKSGGGVKIDTTEAQYDLMQRTAWWEDRGLTKPALDTTAMREYHRETGELLPGMEVVPVTESVKVVTRKGED